MLSHIIWLMASFSYLASLFLLLLYVNLGAFECEAATGSEMDREALLAIKAQIRKDPFDVLSSWNDTTPFCLWPGVECISPYKRRVIYLDLSSLNLEGTVSPFIGNLSYLTEINFQENNFHGEIPREIGNLFYLKVLNLSDNSFQGEILTRLTNCSDLTLIELASNNFAGSIPVSIDSLPNLKVLWLNKNSLTGSIPPSLGNLSSLMVLSLGGNSLEGSIPDDLGRLTSLQFFQVSRNYLSGEVPPSLYNISSIRTFIVANNQLHGSLPWGIGNTLPNLSRLWLALNQFTGPLPFTLSNASKLESFDIALNGFVGLVPDNLGGLQNLLNLDLGQNQLGQMGTNDLSFITGLSNSSRLEVLALQWNNFGGSLPNSVANLSTSLKSLVMGENQFTGSIPSGIENLINLNQLDMGQNLLTGTLPFGVGKLSRLNKLILSNNKFTGEIPSSIGNMTLLNELQLQNNSLWGSIPQSLGKCQNLNLLDVSQNNLIGTIPKQVISLPSLSRSLKLSQNLLTGSLPSEVGSLINLVELDISRNDFSGEVPTLLGKCIMLENLYMNDNNFQGTIPSSLSTLGSIHNLDLSSNKFSGQIPEYLGNFPLLQYLNLSFNDLGGEVPKEGVFRNASRISIFGNRKLCGGIPELKLPSCTLQDSKERGGSLKLKVIVPIVSAIVILIIIPAVLVLCNWKGYLIKKHVFRSLMEDQCMKVSYKELCIATNEFSSDNLIGAGSHGFVYKGKLDKDEKVVAVKALNLDKRGALKSFVAECKALRNVRHRNLIKVLTVCSSVDFKGNDFKALVFEYMPNGNLDKWLHLEEDRQNHLHKLTFTHRLNIAIEVASALEYLHHHCQTPIAHCDLKPSNILLDNDMSAHVGDFGLAKLLGETGDSFSQNQTSSIGIKGSIGYVPPEYGLGGEASTHGDVYSYGILLLEMFTGKRPTDEMFKDGLNLHELAKMAFPSRVTAIVDPQLLLEERSTNLNNAKNNYNEIAKIQECLVSLVGIGVACSIESPEERMEMIDVVKQLQALRHTFVC